MHLCTRKRIESIFAYVTTQISTGPENKIKDIFPPFNVLGVVFMSMVFNVHGAVCTGDWGAGIYKAG